MKYDHFSEGSENDLKYPGTERVNPVGPDIYFEHLRPGGVLFSQPILQ